MLRPFLIAIFGAATLAGCAAAPVTPKVTEPAEPHLTVVAKDVAFDTNGLTMTAGQPTLIYFDNLDDSPHNIKIQTGQGGGATLFDGETITKRAITYTVPQIPVGAYFFLCNVHPAMHGVVTVTP